MKKTEPLQIKVWPKLKEDFRKACEKKGGKTVSEVLRDFMVDFINKNKK